MTRKRRPLTGAITIHWVDAADPDDADQPANFGWGVSYGDPPLELVRAVQLLREVAESLTETLQEVGEGIPSPNDPEDPTADEGGAIVR